MNRIQKELVQKVSGSPRIAHTIAVPKLITCNALKNYRIKKEFVQTIWGSPRFLPEYWGLNLIS